MRSREQSASHMQVSCETLARACLVASDRYCISLWYGRKVISVAMPSVKTTHISHSVEIRDDSTFRYGPFLNPVANNGAEFFIPCTNIKNWINSVMDNNLSRPHIQSEQSRTTWQHVIGQIYHVTFHVLQHTPDIDPFIICVCWVWPWPLETIDVSLPNIFTGSVNAVTNV